MRTTVFAMSARCRAQRLPVECPDTPHGRRDNHRTRAKDSESDKASPKAHGEPGYDTMTCNSCAVRSKRVPLPFYMAACSSGSLLEWIWLDTNERQDMAKESDAHGTCHAQHSEQSNRRCPSAVPAFGDGVWLPTKWPDVQGLT